MLNLLAALFLSVSPPAFAEDSAAPAPAVDAADADGDGTVTGKERRQHRRAERRARRGSKGQHLTDEEADAAEAAESSARGAAATSRAAGAAAALKSALPSADAGNFPGGGGSEKAPEGAAPGPAAKTESAKSSERTVGASGDPSNPKAPADYALAARSGYAPAFAAAGLKLAPDGKSIVRLDGKPATAEDYARLKAEIGAMPAALGRRPDFFNAISPAHYADLKRGYKQKKEGDEVYKDVGTTEGDRDFVHTASCSKLSGNCNKNSEKGSYKKGDFVAPEDLDNMWDALQKELDGTGDGGGMPSLSAARSDIAREKAMEAARALSDGGTSDDDAIKSATQEGPAKKRSPAIQAVASMRVFWRRAARTILPGSAGAPSGEDRAGGLIVGAGALAALGVGALFLRRKG